MVEVHHMESRSDHNDLKNKAGLRPAEQCIPKHNVWLTGKLEEDFDSSRHMLLFGSMKASGELIECS
jgi:hypothetical protein